MVRTALAPLDRFLDRNRLPVLYGVIGTVVILLPALASTKVRSQLASCLDNQRQLAAAWQSYGNDNSDAKILIVFETSPGLDYA